MAHHFGPPQADPRFRLTHHVQARQKTRSLVGPMSLAVDSLLRGTTAKTRPNGNGPPSPLPPTSTFQKSLAVMPNDPPRGSTGVPRQSKKTNDRYVREKRSAR